MTQLQRQHNNKSVDIDSEFLNESCWYCQKEFTDIEDILVDTESDHYICKECAIEHNINTVSCLDIN